MKSIQTLIKLQQRQLDEKRRVLKQLLDQEEMLKAKKEALKQSIIDERKRALEDVQTAYTLAAFIKMTEHQIEAIGEEIIQTQQKIETIRQEIAEIFNVLKRYEIYDKMKEDEIIFEENKREQKDMDEMGLRGFIYKDQT
jgi:flagellar export protein FliJ